MLPSVPISSSFLHICALCFVCAFISACSDRDVILPGERESVLSDVHSLQVDEAVALNPPQLGVASENKSVYHPGLNAGHASTHVVLSLPLKKVWHAKITPPGDNVISLAQPIITSDMVLGLGADAVLSAFDLESGQVKWQAQINDPKSGLFPGRAGGLAGNDNRVAVHAGRNTLTVLDSQTGQSVWSVEHNSPLAGGPTLQDNYLVVTDIDGYMFVYTLDAGILVWQTVGLPVDTVVFGAASPAVNNRQIVHAGAGGEISVHRIDDGQFLWADNVTTIDPITPLQELGDILAHPVHDGQQIFVISQSGLLVSYDAASGTQLWTHPVAGVNMPWIAGDSLFVLSIDGRIICFDKISGAVKWITALDGSTDILSPFSPVALRYFGPVVASDLVHVFSPQGTLVSLDAYTGDIVSKTHVTSRPATAPYIAHNMLIALSRNGKITVFRS